MDFILENIKIFIFLGAGALWVIGKISENRKKRQAEEPWVEIEEDEIPEYSHRPKRPNVPPPLPQVGRSLVVPADDHELSRQQALQERLAQLKRERTAVAKSAQQTKKFLSPNAELLVSPSSMKARLKDPRELRKAIIMREILDPPVSLR